MRSSHPVKIACSSLYVRIVRYMKLLYFSFTIHLFYMFREQVKADIKSLQWSEPVGLESTLPLCYGRKTLILAQDVCSFEECLLPMCGLFVALRCDSLMSDPAF